MILKTLGVKSRQAVRNLVRYVMAEHKMQPARAKPERAPYVPGGRFTARDLKHLASERTDSYLTALLKAFKGTKDEFVRDVLMKGDFDCDRPVLDKLLITHNVPVTAKMPSAQEIIKAYEDNEQYRETKRADMNRATHTMISFHAKDTAAITEQALRAMAERYIQSRNPEGMYTISLHLDRSHVHMHVIESTIGYRTGTSMRMSRGQYAELKKDMQLFQQRFYPSISHSLVRHGKGKDKETRERNFYKNDERTSIKNNLNACVTSILGKATTVGELSEELKKSGYAVYYRNEKPTGVICENGMKVRFSRIGVSEQITALAAREHAGARQLEDMKKLRGKSMGRMYAAERADVKTGTDKSENEPHTELDEMRALRDIRASVVERTEDMDSRSAGSERYEDDTDEVTDITALPGIGQAGLTSTDDGSDINE